MQIGMSMGMRKRNGLTLAQRALSILRRPGITAHVYQPGVGGVSVNGLATGNYTLADGSTGYAANDGLAGLVLDGMGAVGAELVTNGDFSAGTTGWTTIQTGWSISGGVASVNSSGAGSTYLRQGTSIVGATYKITLTVTAYTSGSIYPAVGGTLSGTAITSTGTYTYYLNAADTTGFGVYGQSTTAIATVDNVSCVQVTGIHATQATTADKGILRYTGGRYRWEFDATDSLTATYPAGYESVTVIDAKSTGQVTTTGVNVVGAYSMGPNVVLYGRFVIKGTLSAGELATLQRFANQIAGA